ncbi:MAG: T9SS type A sorting domain-containing protein [Flavobacteriia bacterium]|jgi:hypothetical protein
MKQIFSFLACLFFAHSFAQTWSDNVATIVYEKCTKCHHAGGIAPFSLTTFAEASAMSSGIRDAITNDRMPPFPPDENYQEYAHARALSATEKQTVTSWVDNGSPEGNSANTPPPPVFNVGSILGNGDLEVRMPNYYSKADATHDDYVCISIPTNLTQDRKIKALEIVPGNREIVHHCLVFSDEAGTYVTDTIGGDCSGPADGKLLMGYTPGASPLIFPSGSNFKLGMTLTAGSNIVLAMHYPDGSFGMLDSTKVIFHFYPTNETGIREVTAAAVLENWNIILPPNQVTTLQAQYPPTGTLPLNFSILSVFPHMHQVGTEIKAYGVTAVNDTFPLVHIPEWDFHWQDFYFFKHIVKAPIGSVLKGYAVYDNTINNHHNPNDPPEFVFAGEGTSDEMFLVYFHYMLYMAGDENYDIESLMTLSMEEMLSKTQNEFVVFPNPFEDKIEIRFKEDISNKKISASIYDLQGKLIRELKNNTSENSLIWDGKNEAGKEVSSGTYLISVNNNGNFSHQTIIKK